jgi:hypothetical protein
MDGWLGSGFQPSDAERRSILSGLNTCSIITTSADGALSSRTALIEQVGGNGGILTVRLLGSRMHDDIIPNPRILVTARPAAGPHDLVVINGLARIQSRTDSDGGLELLLLDVAIQRMECWGSAPAAQTVRPLLSPADERPAPRQESLSLSQA